MKVEVFSKLGEAGEELFTDPGDFLRIVVGVHHLMCDYPEDWTNLILDVDEFGIIYNVGVIKIEKLYDFQCHSEEWELEVINSVDLTKMSEFNLNNLTVGEINNLFSVAQNVMRQYHNDPTWAWEH
jgi:hypothetical protein